MKGMASISQSGAYSQEAFRYLLESESKRSERSGDFCQVLLVYHTNRQGAIVQMDSDVAKTVMAALFRCLRDTDYIGWYCAERVVAGVLTVVRREYVAEVFNLRSFYDQLTTTAVRAAAREYLNAQRYVQVTLRPEAK